MLHRPRSADGVDVANWDWAINCKLDMTYCNTFIVDVAKKMLNLNVVEY